MPGSPCRPRPTAIWPGAQGEQGRGGSGWCAAGEGDAERGGPLVDAVGDGRNAVKVVAGVRGGGCDFDDDEVAGGATAQGPVLGWRGGQVVGDDDRAGGHSGGDELVTRGVEVEHVAGVVAVAQEDAAAGVGGQGDRDDLLGGGGGEDVAYDGAVGHARADPAGEGGIVSGSAADDDGNLARG